jgi:putative membrane protein (TIGR04086 family)
MKDFDTLALQKGASVTAIFAVPPTLIARFVIDNSDHPSGWAPLLSLLAICGFVIGSGVAAWHQERGRPLAHGLVAGAGVFLVVQSFFLLIRVATGGEVRVSRIITAFSLALVASIFGGVLGSIMQNSGVRPK